MIIVFCIICFIYNLFILIKYKTIPVSLSETSYMLGKQRYWFILYCIISTFLIMPVLLSAVPESLTLLPFLMGTGLLLSGVSPLFKEGLDKKVHYISSIVAFISFIVLLFLEMSWICIVTFFLLLGGLILWKPNCFVYFAEMLSFLFIIIYLL